MQREVRRSIVSGSRQSPPSAACAHRAIIASSFSDGQSVISNVPLTQSVLSTVQACNSLGADVVAEKGVVDVIGGGEIKIPRQINCNESNTSLKLFMGIFSHFPREVTFNGSGELKGRPLGPFTSYLDRASAFTLNPSGSLPLQLRGPIKSSEMVYFTPLGTQLLSGILLGAPLRDEETEIGIAGDFADRCCLDATVEIMRKSGIELSAEPDFFFVPGSQGYSPLLEFAVPGSRRLSSYLLLAGALAGKCVLYNMPQFKELEMLLASFGAFSKRDEVSFTAAAGMLEAAETDAAHVGALLPHAMVLSCLAKGASRFSGFSRLRHAQKERAKKMVRLLKSMGADISEIPDGLLIRGGKLSGARIAPGGDPHAAMACAIAGLAAEGPTIIDDAECIDKIYPSFFRDLVSLGAIVR